MIILHVAVAILALLTAIVLMFAMVKFHEGDKNITAAKLAISLVSAWLLMLAVYEPLIVDRKVNAQAAVIAQKLVLAYNAGLNDYIQARKEYSHIYSVDEHFIRQNFRDLSSAKIGQVDPAREEIFTYNYKINLGGKVGRTQWREHYFVYKHNGQYLLAHVTSKGYNPRYDGSVVKTGSLEIIKSIEIRQKDPKTIGGAMPNDLR